MSDSSKNELLEPTGISSSSILNVCGPKESVQKPKIGERYLIESTVYVIESESSLPKLKPAENELKRKIGEHDMNVEMSEVSFLSYFFSSSETENVRHGRNQPYHVEEVYVTQSFNFTHFNVRYFMPYNIQFI